VTPDLEASPSPRRVADSRVEINELVMPEDANVLGSVFGGRVMALIDKAGAMVALRHCRSTVVTAAVDSIDFISPLELGYIMNYQARLTQVFRSSLEVRVDVYGENTRTGIRKLTTTAFVTMVCLGSEGSPRPAPPLLLETDEERAEAARATRRREARLARRRSEGTSE
jgi:acyl-CoA hydrolase